MIDELDRHILAALQEDFPLQRRPYHVLAARLATDEQELFRRVSRLTQTGVIRRLGPRYRTRGFRREGALVAACVGDQRLEDVAHLLDSFHQVTHCYQRTGSRYNLWFTLTADRDQTVATLIERLRLRTGEPDMHALPALKVYKLRVRFALFDGQPESEPDREAATSNIPPEPDETDRRIIILTQAGLPLSIDPFEELAGRLDIPVEEVLERLGQMCEHGLIRTMGAVLNGPALGYHGNVLVAWRLSQEEHDRVGRTFARLEAVSHCYRRPALADFPYTLYTMVHGRSVEECSRLVRRMSESSGVKDYLEMPTVREFKKTSVRLF